MFFLKNDFSYATRLFKKLFTNNTYSHTSTQFTLFLLSLAILMLFSSTAIADVEETTTLGTRTTLSEPNPPITSNANAQWEEYSRKKDYYRTYTYPLQYIDTRAGDKLAVRVSVPANIFGKPKRGRFPAILTQTAYRIGVGNTLGTLLPIQNTLVVGGTDKFMVKHGYVTVAVDVFGSGMSTGVTNLIGAEEQEAYADAVEWITQQSWFDGNLGLAGTSYLSITALLTASEQNPAVKAVFAEMPMGDAYRGTVGPGGLLNAKFISVWLMLTEMLCVSNQLAMILYPEYADVIEAATQDHVEAIDTFYLPTIYNGLDGDIGIATDDGDFWAIRSPVDKAKDISVPTFIVGCDMDIFQRGEPLLYEQLKNNVNSKLLILPGAHLQAIMESAFPHRNNALSEGPPATSTILLQWFDHYLKGIDTGVEDLPNVTQFVRGHGFSGGRRFSTATDWPHPEASPLRFFLHGDMSLDNESPASNEPTHEIYEPDAPVVTININEKNEKYVTGEVDINDSSDCSYSIVQWTLGFDGLIPKSCYFDNTVVEEAQDALIYETEPMESDLYINGPMMAEIWMSATNTQAALAIRIDDVNPSGEAKPVTSGLQSAAHRAVDESRSRYVNGVMVQPWHPFTTEAMQAVEPGTPILVQVEIFPTAALIRKGHRLRLAISSSNQAMGIWTYPQQAEADGNITTILNDPEHPSSLVMLSVPTSELK